jgi:DNA-binding transcriptional ArsR family regulator
MLNRVWRLHLRIPLSSNERLVLLALADRCNGAGVCWPGLTDLAGRTGLSRRTIRRILRRLERHKVVVTDRRRGRTSRYHLSLNDPASEVNTPDTTDRGIGRSSGVNTPDTRVRRTLKNPQTIRTEMRRMDLPLGGPAIEK